MPQSTARTGPARLFRPETITPAPTAWDGDLEAAFHQIRQIAQQPTPGPVPSNIRFAIETAKGLAENAPDLYGMSAGAAARFRLIANFLTGALDDADQLALEANR